MKCRFVIAKVTWHSLPITLEQHDEIAKKQNKSICIVHVNAFTYGTYIVDT